MPSFLISSSRPVSGTRLLRGPYRNWSKENQIRKIPVIIENRTVSSVLYPLYSAMLGSSIYQKQSFLIGKENQAVASPKLTVYDDPFIKSGFGQHSLTVKDLLQLKEQSSREVFCVISTLILIMLKN